MRFERIQLIIDILRGKIKSTNFKKDDYTDEDFFNSQSSNFISKINLQKPISDSSLTLINKFQQKKPEIDIIIPINEWQDETLYCIQSILKAKNKINYEIVVLNNSSINSKHTSELLILNEKKIITLLHYKNYSDLSNLIKKCMQLHPERNVILLNHNTEVYDGWLDKLTTIAERNPTVATISPLCNCSAIYSYPSIYNQNYILEFNPQKLNDICFYENKYNIFDIPLGETYCMFIRKKALNEIDLPKSSLFFEESTVENNEFKNLIKKNYRNVIATGIFVRYYGKNVIKKIDTIKSTSQVYFDLIKVDCARLESTQKKSLIKVLHISHSRGGGIEKFVNDLHHSLLKKKINSYILKIAEKTPSKLAYIENNFIYLPNLVFSSIYEPSKFEFLLKRLAITHIHVHHLIGYPNEFLDMLLDVCKKFNIKITTTIHDFYCRCPLINLMRNDSKLCYDFNLNDCEYCTKLNKVQPAWIQIKNYERLFKSSYKVTVPNSDVIKYIYKIFPNTTFEVIPHNDNNDIHPLKIKKITHNVFTVGVIGHISKIKGLNVLISLNKYIKKQNLPIKIIVIGTVLKKKSQKLEIKVTGEYHSEKEAREHIKKNKIDLLFLPSIVPETYSYVYSLCLRTGIPTAVFDIGAPSKRAISLGLENTLIPIEFSNNPKKLIEYLLKINLSNNSILQTDAMNIDPLSYYH